MLAASAAWVLRMTLVAWNETRSSGRGRMGTLYLIARAGTAWSVSVDGDVICSVDSAAAAAARAEYLEALKHVACGRGRELSRSQLQCAALVAREMKQASDEVLRAGRLPGDELETIDLYCRHLAALLEAIAGEQSQRNRARPSS